MDEQQQHAGSPRLPPAELVERCKAEGALDPVRAAAGVWLTIKSGTTFEYAIASLRRNQPFQFGAPEVPAPSWVRYGFRNGVVRMFDRTTNKRAYRGRSGALYETGSSQASDDLAYALARDS